MNETTINRALLNPNEISSKVMRLVSTTFGIAPTMILSRTKTERVAKARQACFWLLVEHGVSQAEIGRIFDRDDGAVAHGHKAIAWAMDVNTKFKDRMEYLKREIQKEAK